MADLSVQPKQKKPWVPWLLLILGIIALLFFLLRGCNNDNGEATGTDSTSAAAGTGAGNTATASPSGSWNEVDFNAPNASYEEITDKNITVRGNDNYGIYSLGENILFDEGKATIRSDAEQNLKQVVG